MKVYEWLTTHAGEYGFCQVYADESGRPGCAIEKWHWSYLPLAETYLQIYNSVITYQDLDQFSGSGQADDLEVISRYVNGISTACREINKISPDALLEMVRETMVACDHCRG